MRINQLGRLKIRDNLSIKETVAYQKISFWCDLERFLYNEIKRGKCKPTVIDFLKVSLGKYHLLSRLIISWVFGKTVRFKEDNIAQKKILIVSNQINWGPPSNPFSKKMKEDKYFEPIIQACKNRYRVVALSESSELSTIIKSLLERKNYQPNIWKPVGSFLTFNAFYRALIHSKAIEKKWCCLKRTSIFKKYADSLTIKLDFFFKYIIFEYIFYIELMKQAIETEKPDLIIIEGEYFGLGRAAVIAGRLKNVPTLALQHGIIHPYHNGYVYPKNEVFNKVSLQHYVLPDKTAVYGKYTEKVLTEICNYPPENVVVTGSPRYDVLVKAKQVFKKERFLAQYGLDPLKKTVLLITQGYHVSHDFLRATVKALKQFSEIQAMIKPHPGDVEPEWHSKILQKENYHALVLDPESNTFEALFACDLMLTVSSTVAIEAMFLNKPVVIVNLTGEPDPMPYVESGAALGAYREQDVAPAIRKALFDEDIRKELEKNREKFVKHHLHNIGIATKNVVRLVEEMIRTSLDSEVSHCSKKKKESEDER